MKQQKSFKNMERGKLYLVPTPIGNLEDITYRSLKTLKESYLIASEDTRNTQKLLNHFEITTKQISLHEHNVKERLPYLIALLKEGKMISQVSDAGMPSISDPGHELVLEAIKEDIDVISLPGATAGVTALISSGLAPEPFLFYGFLPRKKNSQQKALESLKNIKATLIFYESPHRVVKTLTNMIEILGENRKATLCRELTKIYEEYTRGTLRTLEDYLSAQHIKGECCLIVEGNLEEDFLQKEMAELSCVEHVNLLIENKGLKTNEAIKEVAKLRKLKKQVVYKEFHDA